VTELLLSPLDVGPVRLRNRVVMSAMTTGFGYSRGLPDEALVAYLRTRTRDVAMAVVAFGAVAPEGRVEERIPWMWRPEAAAALAPVAVALREGGGLACLQLGHGGRQVSPAVSGEQPVAPSPIPPPAFVREVPRELSTGEAEAIVEAFGSAAAAAVEAGFDAIEIHGGHGYLIHQFLSAQANARTDRYGGATVEERARFGTEVVERVRAAAPGVAVVVRMNGADLVPDGMSSAEATVAAGAFAAAGADALLVSAGVYGSVPYTIPLLDDPEAPYVEGAAHVRAHVDVPVIAVGGFARPAVAEAALRRGDCDAVAVGRALLADPDWVAKARAGRAADIRPCIATVDSCAGMLAHGEAISCAVNPEVGRETRPPPARARRPGRVVVVGGGPAGMEAACRAAQLGHEAVLVEREDRLGGALALAARTPPLARLARLVDWYERRLRAAGVEVRLSEAASSDAPLGVAAPDALLDETALAEADLVVVATGARTEPPVLDGYDELATWTVEDLLAERPSSLGSAGRPARPVVFGDGRIALATVLAFGPGATLLSRDRPGGDASGLVRRGYLARLDRAGVERVRGVPARLSAGGVWRDGELVEADGLVLADRRVPDRPAGVDGVRVGDARSPRDLAAAIAEGREAVDAFTRART
jgi:2,4-dienoyl-CoA reductase-like NADH-dependent reductase (Old Yellow Enzyme family)